MEIVSKSEGSTLTADEFNQIPDELENVITNAGLTKSGDNLSQVSQSITQMVGDANFFSTSGTANAIKLSVISPRLSPVSLRNGYTVRFRAIYNNTGSATVQLGSFASKKITYGGDELNANDILAGHVYSLTYVTASNTFELFKATLYISYDSDNENLTIG